MAFTVFARLAKIGFWQVNNRLPLTNAELGESLKQQCEELDAKLPEQLWAISDVTEQAIKEAAAGKGGKS